MVSVVNNNFSDPTVLSNICPFDLEFDLRNPDTTAIDSGSGIVLDAAGPDLVLDNSDYSYADSIS